MPELPEVETIRRGLLRKILGRKIIRVHILVKKMFQGSPKSILNQEIINVLRRGKVLKILFENDFLLLVHFKLNGQLFYKEKDSHLSSKFTHIILDLDSGVRLLFNDQRKFAWMKVVAQQKYSEKDFGIEPLTPNFTIKNFKKAALSSSEEIKAFLMNQEKIAGLGNIYANEALYLAKINPFKKAKELSENEINELHKAIINVIERAIAQKGSSGRDNEYRQIDGTLGTFQKSFNVYQREGEPCNKCGEKIKREKQKGRSTYFCPKCQG